MKQELNSRIRTVIFDKGKSKNMTDWEGGIAFS